MIQILEYIAQNYTLFLSVLVLILLAIIGYYADKTNFGQGNKEKETKNKIEDLEEKDNKVEEFKETDDKIENSSEGIVTENVVIEKVEEQKQEEINYNVNEEFALQEEQRKAIDKDSQMPESTEFEEIDSLLPKKELINNDLLNEIEGMELNSLKQKASFDVPDLDDISLPKIKNLVEKEQDIWKF